MKVEHTLKQTIESPGFIVRIYSPNISEEERNRRMKAIHKAAEALLKAAHKK